MTHEEMVRDYKFEHYMVGEDDYKRVNTLSRTRQAEMLKRGWTLEIMEHCRDYPTRMYKRLSAKYSQVKIYEHGTMVKGIKDYYAMCK